MTLADIYDFFFNYEVSAFFAALLRILYVGIPLFGFLFLFKPLVACTHPVTGWYDSKDYKAQCKDDNYSLFKLFPESIFVYWLIIFLIIVSGVTSLLGLYTNLSLFVFFITGMSFYIRAKHFVACAQDIFLKISLFSLIFLDCGAKYSLDSYLGISSGRDWVDGWSVRLVQINLCLAYTFAGFTKVNISDWNTGNVLKHAVLDLRIGRRNRRQYVENAPLNKIAAYCIVVFQVFSFVFYFTEELRPIAITFGTMLHLAIFFLLRLGIFGPLVILANLSFLGYYL